MKLARDRAHKSITLKGYLVLQKKIIENVGRDKVLEIIHGGERERRAIDYILENG